MQSLTSKPWSRWVGLVGPVGVIVLAALLRIPTIGSDSLWIDEAASWTQARRDFVDMLAATAKDNYPPLHNVILHLAIRMFGDNEWVLRLPSAFLGIGTVGLLLWIGTSLGSRRTGLLAALLLALSGFHIWYSQEARMYALYAFSATWLAGALFAFMKSRTTASGVAAALATAALLYSHPFGVLTWVSILAPAAALEMASSRREGRRALFGGQLVAAALFIPWAVVLVQRSERVLENGFWIPPLTLTSFYKNIELLATGPIGLAVICAGLVVLAVRFRSLKGNERSVVVVLICWAIIPILAAAGISVLALPLFISRYLIASLPAFVLLAAIGFAGLRFPTSAVAVPVIVAAAMSAAMIDKSPGARADWRSVAQHLAANGTMADCVVVYPGFNATALAYYRRDTPCLMRGNPNKAPALPPATQRVFIVVNQSVDVADSPLGDFMSTGWVSKTHEFHPLVVFDLQPDR